MVDGLRILPSVMGCNARPKNVSGAPDVRAAIAFYGGLLGQHCADLVLRSWSKLASAYYMSLWVISTLGTAGSRKSATRRIPNVCGGTTALMLTLDHDGSCLVVKHRSETVSRDATAAIRHSASQSA